jgi:hypothetical protein
MTRSVRRARLKPGRPSTAVRRDRAAASVMTACVRTRILLGFGRLDYLASQGPQLPALRPCSHRSANSPARHRRRGPRDELALGRSIVADEVEKRVEHFGGHAPARRACEVRLRPNAGRRSLRVTPRRASIVLEAGEARGWHCRRHRVDTPPRRAQRLLARSPSRRAPTTARDRRSP